MYCLKCGAEIEDNKQFCVFCGTRQSPMGDDKEKAETKEKQQSSNTAKKNRKKVFIGVAIAAIIIAAGIGLKYYLSRPVEIDLNQYVTITSQGYDGMGTAGYEFDYEAFREDYHGKIKQDKSKKEEIVQLANDMGVEKSDTIAILYKAYIDAMLSKTENLSNGDNITLQWYCSKESALKYFNVKLKYKDVDYVISDLKAAKEIDPFENISISYDGYVGDGIATVENNNEDEELMGLVYILDTESNLSNGMKIVLKVTDSAGGDPTEEWLENHGVHLTSVEKTYVVSGLKNIREIDAFSVIKVTFEGANGLGIPKAVFESDDEELQGLQFRYSSSEKLANYDKVTVTITDAEGNNPNKALEEKYGAKIKSLSQTFQVEGLKEYATKASEIPKETMDAMKKQAEDMINAHVAKNYHNRSDWSETLQTLVYTGNYFFNLKDGYDESTKDCILLVYKANVNMIRIDSNGHYNFNENMDIYYVVSFGNLYMNDDGSVYIDLAKGNLSGEGASKTYYNGYAVNFSKAYNTMDFLKKDRVTPNLEKYTIEENFN